MDYFVYPAWNRELKLVAKWEDTGKERFKRRYCGWLRNPVALGNGIPFFTLQIVGLCQGMFTIYQLENFASPSTVSPDILQQQYISCCARKSLWTPQSQRADFTGGCHNLWIFWGSPNIWGYPKKILHFGWGFSMKKSKLLGIHWYRSRADEKKHGCENHTVS